MVVEIGSCEHGIPAGTQCDDCNLEMLYQCPYCSRYAAKMKDREGLAKLLQYESPEECSLECALGMADAVIRWMEE